MEDVMTSFEFQTPETVPAPIPDRLIDTLCELHGRLYGCCGWFATTSGTLPYPTGT